jgi:stage III sporulation protein SpoIIIAA
MRHLTLLLMKQLSPMLLMSPQGNGKTTAIRNITEEFSTTLLPHEITLPVFSYSKELQ